MNTFEIEVFNTLNPASKPVMVDENMIDITDALFNANIEGEDVDGIGNYLRDGYPNSVFVEISQLQDAVKIINGLGFETDEDEITFDSTIEDEITEAQETTDSKQDRIDECTRLFKFYEDKHYDSKLKWNEETWKRRNHWEAELATAQAMPETSTIFVNISERYGNPEIVTVADYEELNPQSIFKIRNDEIHEYDAGDIFIEVVAEEYIPIPDSVDETDDKPSLDAETFLTKQMENRSEPHMIFESGMSRTGKGATLEFTKDMIALHLLSDGMYKISGYSFTFTDALDGARFAKLVTFICGIGMQWQAQSTDPTPTDEEQKEQVS